MRDSHDFIVVGAGSAGCALARRLSDADGASVLLIEAGPDDRHPDIHTPSTYYHLWGGELDWDYESSPQPGTAGRVHRLPRGRVLGGTSAINGMVYLRGAQADFDGWAQEGCTGWGWTEVRSAYEEMEKLLAPSVVTGRNALSETFIQAAREAGFALNEDFDDGSLDGCGWNRSSIDAGRRSSSYRAFVHPVLAREDLDVLSGAFVERLLIDDGGTIGGVIARVDGQVRELRGSQVILCAGAYDSPRLLLKSGIGPAEQLAANGVKPLVDLPVGENLQDHLLVGIVYESRSPIEPAHAHITECCAFARSSKSPDRCDIEISFNKEMHFAPPADDDIPRYTIIPGVTGLRSRGAVRLAGAKLNGGLEIDHAYFAEPDDMKMMIEAVRRSRQIGSSPALAERSGGTEFFPGLDVDSDEQIDAYVRHNVSTWFHPAGTCKMGDREDAVVDAELRVRGTSGLRVADASIMPTIVSVNTNAASMMIGWKAAEAMLE